jgi:gas vesicle protein
MAENEDSGRLTWFVAGAVVGAAVALLYAPKAGKDTRKYISKKADAGKDAISDTSKELVDKSKELYDKGRQIADDAADLFERGRKLVRG